MGILDKISGKEKKEKASAKKAPAKKAAAKKEEAHEHAHDEHGHDHSHEAEKPKAPAVRGPLAREGAGDSHRILMRPVLTEKSSLLQAQGKYVFEVALKATKNDVARAVRDLYGVKPTSVRMLKVMGKNVRFGRFAGKEKDVKKAVVTLKSGESLAVLE